MQSTLIASVILPASVILKCIIIRSFNYLIIQMYPSSFSLFRDFVINIQDPHFYGKKAFII